MSEPPVLESTESETGPMPADTMPEPPGDEVLEDDLLVEEISIDGMCGVY